MAVKPTSKAAAARGAAELPTDPMRQASQAPIPTSALSQARIEGSLSTISGAGPFGVVDVPELGGRRLCLLSRLSPTGRRGQDYHPPDRGRSAAAMSGWRAVSLDDLEAVSLFQGLLWQPVRREFGIRAFGINAYRTRNPDS